MDLSLNDEEQTFRDQIRQGLAENLDPPPSSVASRRSSHWDEPGRRAWRLTGGSGSIGPTRSAGTKTSSRPVSARTPGHNRGRHV
jgi:hypothetical protein